MLTFQVAFWCAFVHSTNYSVECSGSSFIDERRMYTQPLRLANCYEPLDLLQNHERQIQFYPVTNECVKLMDTNHQNV